jgi:hypothetical protein
MKKHKKLSLIIILLVFALMLACQCNLSGIGLPGSNNGFQPGDCEPGTQQLLMDESLQATIAGGSTYESKYVIYCLWVPDGGSSLTIGLRDFNVDLDLYINQDYQTLLASDNLGEYYSRESGTTPEEVTIPGAGGRYYIQIFMYDDNATTGFTLYNTFTP